MQMLNLSRIRIIAIGKQRPGWLHDGAAMYCKRLVGLEIIELKDSTPDKEAQAVLASLKNNEKLLLLSEDGKHFSSRQLANELNEQKKILVSEFYNISKELAPIAWHLLLVVPMATAHS